jgi:hypothetical protein
VAAVVAQVLVVGLVETLTQQAYQEVQRYQEWVIMAAAQKETVQIFLLFVVVVAVELEL